MKLLPVLPVFAFIFALGACVHSNVTELDQTAADRNPAGKYDKQFGESEQDLSFRELKDILQQKQFSKIDDLLAYIKVKKPTYMQRYSLAYESRSLHGSSYDNPRALVYGRAGNLIITFNGSPEQDAYEMLEVMSFNGKDSKFEFYEIKFNEKNLAGQPPFDISPDGGPKQKCLGCHSNSRPIWETYNLWTGFYGAADDFPINADTQLDRILLPTVSNFPRNPPQVVQQWKDFKNNRLGKGRYSHLGPLASSVVLKIYYGMQNSLRPNADLGAMIFEHNVERMNRLLKNAGPVADDVGAALMYALICDRDSKPLGELGLFHRFSEKTELSAFDDYRSRLIAHVRQQGYNWQKLQDELIQAGKMKPDRRTGNKFDFFNYLINWQIEQPGQAKVKLTLFGNFMSVVEKYVPSAQVLTWPTNFSEGVFMFNSGVDEQLIAMKRAFSQSVSEISPPMKAVSEAYQQESQRGYLNAQNSDSQCRDLFQKSAHLLK